MSKLCNLTSIIDQNMNGFSYQMWVKFLFEMTYIHCQI